MTAKIALAIFLTLTEVLEGVAFRAGRVDSVEIEHKLSSRIVFSLVSYTERLLFTWLRTDIKISVEENAYHTFTSAVFGEAYHNLVA